MEIYEREIHGLLELQNNVTLTAFPHYNGLTSFWKEYYNFSHRDQKFNK